MSAAPNITPITIVNPDATTVQPFSGTNSSNSSTAGQPWSCRSCGHTNAFSITHLSATASVPCHKCGSFQTLTKRPATATHRQPINTHRPFSNSTGNETDSNGRPMSPPVSSKDTTTSLFSSTSSFHSTSNASVPSVTSRSPLSLTPEASLDRFQSFLRLRTVANEGTTNGANEAAVEFLRAIGENMGLRTAVHEYAPHRPILVMTLQGRDPSLPSVLLNSHYDVVPVMQEKWKVDAFAAELDESTGQIFARGTQDMKCVCMQYLEAMLRLVRQNKQVPFLRTVHLSYQPDEETGGEWGMQQWVQTPEFRALNIGFALDEGIANPNDEYTVFYGERGVWWMTVKATGPTGHASRFIPNPATMKLMRSVQHFLDYRDVQEKKLLHGHSNHSGECGHALSKKLELGDVITLNLTVLKAGVSVDGGKTYSFNVVPMEAEAGFDLRLPPHVNLEEFEAKVKEWTSEEGLSYTVRKFSAEYVTRIDDERNPFWKVFRTTLEGFGSGTTKVAPQIFPAGTDSRFLRKAGIPVIGFSPLRNTPVLLHDHNEFIHKDIFLEGISVYETLIPALAEQPIHMANTDGVYLETKQPLDIVKSLKADAATGGLASALVSPAPQVDFICPNCHNTGANPFNNVLSAKFPGALPLDEFIFQTKSLLVPRGFFPQVNTLVCVGLCRDEITSPFEEEVEALWGQAFICGSLGGMLFCGDTGFGAAHHHAPANGHFIYYCFTHIAIDDEGNIGAVWRTRSGMDEKTTACGALAAFTDEIASGRLALHLDEDDIEQSMLKKHIVRKTKLSTDPRHPPDLFTVTLAAYDTITQDLERHVLNDSQHHLDRLYALFTGVQVHGPDGSDFVWLGKSSMCTRGHIEPLPFVKLPPMDWEQLTPPVLPSAFEE